MIILLHGPYTYSSKQYIKQLKKAYRRKHDQERLSLHHYHGDSISLDQFRQATLGGGLFSSKQLIVIENFFTSGKNSDLLTDLEQRFDQLVASTDTILVIWEGPDAVRYKSKIFDKT